MPLDDILLEAEEEMDKAVDFLKHEFRGVRTGRASTGLVDGMRVGRDIGAKWDHILPSAIMGTRLYFFHGRVWHNDPDCLMVRKPMTLDQARAWGSWIAVSGQLNMVSEWLPRLPAVEALFGVVGHPVEHSIEPRLHNLAYRRLGLRPLSVFSLLFLFFQLFHSSFITK